MLSAAQPDATDLSRRPSIKRIISPLSHLDAASFFVGDFMVPTITKPQADPAPRPRDGQASCCNPHIRLLSVRHQSRLSSPSAPAPKPRSDHISHDRHPGQRAIHPLWRRCLPGTETGLCSCPAGVRTGSGPPVIASASSPNEPPVDLVHDSPGCPQRRTTQSVRHRRLRRPARTSAITAVPAPAIAASASGANMRWLVHPSTCTN
jgi:hypothetical protein